MYDDTQRHEGFVRNIHYQYIVYIQPANVTEQNEALNKINYFIASQSYIT